MPQKDYTEAELRAKIGSDMRTLSFLFEDGAKLEDIATYVAIVAWMADCLCGEELMRQKKEWYKLSHQRTLQGLCYECGVPVGEGRTLCDKHHEELKQSLHELADQFEKLRQKVAQQQVGGAGKPQ